MREFNTVPTFNELANYNPDLKACLFDMDGTIFNSEPLHMNAMETIFVKNKKLAISAEKLEQLCIGKTDSQIFKEIKEQYKINFCEITTLSEKEELMKAGLLEINPGECRFFDTNFIELFKELKSNKIKILLVTSSEKQTAHDLLSHFKLTSFFDNIITREDTSLNKPHPMPYLHALKLSNTEPDDVIIFEDSDVGIESGTQVTDFIIKALWY